MRRTRPWLMLAVALASGGVAALLAMRYLRQQAHAAAARPPKTGTWSSPPGRCRSGRCWRTQT